MLLDLFVVKYNHIFSKILNNQLKKILWYSFIQKFPINFTFEIKRSTFSKCIKDINLITQTIKLKEENTEEKLPGIGFGNDFWVITPKI